MQKRTRAKRTSLNIGDNIYTYAYVVSVRVYIYIYIFCTEYCSFLLYKRFPGIIILSRNSNGTMLIFDRLFIFFFFFSSIYHFFCSFLPFRYRHFVYMTINLTFANYAFYRAVTRSLRTLIIARAFDV